MMGTGPVRLRLRLYVAGDGPNGTSARENLRAILAHLRPADVRLEIIDVLEQPARGLRDGVLVTPMLVKAAPGPERRVFGNLRDRKLVMATCGILSADGPPRTPHE